MRVAHTKCFNPRTHTGCDNKVQNEVKKASEFQSTHPHGVRRVNDTFCAYKEIVSIHAPTRGATLFDLKIYQLVGVSIHAPTRGATFFFKGKDRRSSCFNPRTHTGCDDLINDLDIRWVNVSIHAPTRGATVPFAHIRRW